MHHHINMMDSIRATNTIKRNTETENKKKSVRKKSIQKILEDNNI